jgi:hypothetical protein
MRRNATLMLVSVLVQLAAGVHAQTLSDLNAAVDLETTIRSLAEGVESGDYEAPPKYFVLNGTLDSVFETDEASSMVVIEMVTGEWIGLDEVRSYHCLIRFEGEQYVRAFPANVPRDAGPEIFARNSRLMVVAAPVAVVELTDGRLLWLLDGVYLRRI